MKRLTVFLVCAALVAGLSGMAWGADIFVESAKGNMYKVQRMLDDDPFKATEADNEGNTPLHAAASEGKAEIVQLLLDYGADVNAKTTTGITPLHDAAGGGYKKVVEMLLDNGADINARTDDGDTPLSMAMEKGHFEVADFLSAAGGTI